MTAPSVRTLRWRPGTALLALVVATLVASTAGAPAALAADATIEGTVVNGTTATAAADLPVTVVYFDASGKIGQANVRADSSGRFSVTPPAAAQGYQVAATYKGTEYRTPATQLLAGQPSVSKLQVFEPTATTTDVTQTDWVVWLDREGDGIAVQQDFGWANRSDAAYVGKDGTVVTVPLPPQAAGFQYLGTFLEDRGSVTADSYLSGAPIVPGTSTATIRFTAPGTPSLQFPVTFPTKSFQMFVPAGITVTSPQLRLAGTTTDQGVTYQVLTANGALQPGAVLDASLQVEAAQAANSSTTLLVAIAGIAALAAFGFWLFGRRRARAQRAAAPKGPVKKPAKQQATKARVDNGGRRTAAPKATRGTSAKPAAAPDTDEDVDLLIDEIAALDLSFEQGLLEERTYRRLRVAAKDRLLAAQSGRELTLKE